MNEGGPKGRTVYRAVGIGGVLIAAAIITLYTPWLGLFNLRVIVVRGNNHITSREIVRVSGLGNGGPLARLPIHQAERALETIPWVQKADVIRDYPHAVRITITERIPIAALRVGKDRPYLIVGEDGVIVAKEQGDVVPYLVATGVTVTEEAPGGCVRDANIVDALDALNRRGIGPKMFTVIDFSNPSGVVLHSSAGTEVLFGPVGTVPERVKELMALLPTLDLKDYRSIDLRFGGEAILVPRKVVSR